MSLRLQLRERTQTAHGRLDALWRIDRLREREPYTQFLQATASALVPLEARLQSGGVEKLLPDWPARSRAASVVDDLAGLGAGFSPATAPALDGAAAQFGALYVLEGSRLGGSLIAREVARSGDPAVLANRRYLGHGKAGRLWNDLLDRLERLPAAELERLCRGALETFALFEVAAREVLVTS